MIDSKRDYDEVYRSRSWAYSDRPDPELIRALVGKPRGKALDLGGGQGRHALALSALGYDVTIVDSAATGLHQAAEAAEEKSLPIHCFHSDASKYEPDGSLEVVVAALFFHIPAHKTSLKIAERAGASLNDGGVFYVSIPGYSRETHSFAEELIAAAGCRAFNVEKHLVTKKERPRLPVPRRNETRAVAFK